MSLCRTCCLVVRCQLGCRCRGDRGLGWCWLFQSAANEVTSHRISNCLLPWCVAREIVVVSVGSVRVQVNVEVVFSSPAPSSLFLVMMISATCLASGPVHRKSDWNVERYWPCFWHPSQSTCNEKISWCRAHPRMASCMFSVSVLCVPGCDAGASETHRGVLLFQTSRMSMPAFLPT